MTRHPHCLLHSAPGSLYSLYITLRWVYCCQLPTAAGVGCCWTSSNLHTAPTYTQTASACCLDLPAFPAVVCSAGQHNLFSPELHLTHSFGKQGEVSALQSAQYRHLPCQFTRQQKWQQAKVPKFTCQYAVGSARVIKLDTAAPTTACQLCGCCSSSRSPWPVYTLNDNP